MGLALSLLELKLTQSTRDTEASEMNHQSMLGAGGPGPSQPDVIRGERFWTDILLTTDKLTMER